tara:strand:- start:87 stop:347 length:261 start_codon:yes stop_codon:yes gene_type:complete
MVATLLVKVILTPPGRPLADAVSVLLQVVLKVYTVSVIAVVADTVCDCGPEVSTPDIVQGMVVVDTVVDDAVVELAVEVDAVVAAT